VESKFFSETDSQHPSKKKGKLHSHVRHYFLSALNTFARRLSLSLSGCLSWQTRGALLSSSSLLIKQQKRADVGNGENELRESEIRPRGQSEVGKGERNVVVSKEWEW
jgi:hypothetical protein